MTQMELFGAYLPKQTPFSLTLPQRRLQSYVQPIVATVNSLAQNKKSFRPFLKITLFNFLIFLKLFIVGTIGRSMHSPFPDSSSDNCSREYPFLFYPSLVLPR